MRAWEREHGRGDPKVYDRELMPRIQEMTVPQLMKLTGLSRFHCWKVRKREIAGCTHVIGRQSVLGSVVVP
jgi:hypothetical protein